MGKRKKLKLSLTTRTLQAKNTDFSNYIICQKKDNFHKRDKSAKRLFFKFMNSSYVETSLCNSELVLLLVAL